MKKYLRRFAHHSDYESYIGGDNALLPNVSVCDDDDSGIVHFNPNAEPTSPYVVAKFYVEDDSEPTAISGLDYYGEDPNDYFSRIWIDGEEMEEINTYASLSNGKHTIEYELIDNTEISDLIFHQCYSLTEVTIPNTVTSIGWSFQDCENLKKVTIPNSVTSIVDNAFEGCSGLTSVTIPSSVTSIGYGAFSRCSSLTSVTIPNSVESIGVGVFSSCSGMTTIIVESGNTHYDSRDNCNAIIETASNTLIVGSKNTTIPNSVTSIGNSAFYGCSSLTSITIPSSVTSIGSHAFIFCKSLTSVTIPNSVTSIGGAAFSSCSGLTSITIGSGVTSIGNNAFSSCSGLTTMTIEATTPPTLGNTDAISTATTTVYVPSASVNTYKSASIWSSFASKIQAIP